MAGEHRVKLCRDSVGFGMPTLLTDWDNTPPTPPPGPCPSHSISVTTATPFAHITQLSFSLLHIARTEDLCHDLG
jgi:hypothetical protein